MDVDAEVPDVGGTFALDAWHGGTWQGRWMDGGDIYRRLPRLTDEVYCSII